LNAALVTSVRSMQEAVSEVRSSGRRIALVPTMGALHEGHLALIRKAASVADWVVTSVFVNPTQFGPGEDYERYPRDVQEDTRRALGAGSHVVFAPEPKEMYPEGYRTFVMPGAAADTLEGAIRPDHFRGVATVVAKLFNITMPHVAVFGQKDIQQAFIVRCLVRDLNMSVEILVEPTVREPDGLAMSSRNRYLSPDERSRAACLSRALKTAQALLQAGERSAAALRRAIEHELQKGAPTAIDYVAIVDPESFHAVDPVGPRGAVIALAARFGTTRLIDNAIIVPTPHEGNF